MKNIQPQLVTPCFPNLSFLFFSIFVESLQTLKPAQDAQTGRGKSTGAEGAECPPPLLHDSCTSSPWVGGSETASGVLHQVRAQPGVTSPQRARSSLGSSTGTESKRSQGAGQRAAVTPDQAGLQHHPLSCGIRFPPFLLGPAQGAPSSDRASGSGQQRWAGMGRGTPAPPAGPLLGGLGTEKPGPEAAGQGSPHEAAQLFFSKCTLL